MRLALSAVSLAILAAAPLSAADLRTTHQEIAVPPGKLHAKAFRPITPQPCATARANPSANPSGSRVAATLPARGTAGCLTEAAEKVALAD
ncbi:hypothetical protein ASD39_21145 [Sphingomonas sp. Root50]|nr:hypothetical protein ASD17_17250 [Sphingomonas sp. Root1294]KQY70968.1 hypothetical protein ASD39_21145 [Sphingomonas sp. Root50]KRB92216.1 hypothetical protein ASE22_09165 [Sphingomonas sp. Root720]